MNSIYNYRIPSNNPVINVAYFVSAPLGWWSNRQVVSYSKGQILEFSMTPEFSENSFCKTMLKTILSLPLLLPSYLVSQLAGALLERDLEWKQERKKLLTYAAIHTELSKLSIYEKETAQSPFEAFFREAADPLLPYMEVSGLIALNETSSHLKTLTNRALCDVRKRVFLIKKLFHPSLYQMIGLKRMVQANLIVYPRGPSTPHAKIERDTLFFDPYGDRSCFAVCYQYFNTESFVAGDLFINANTAEVYSVRCDNETLMTYFTLFKLACDSKFLKAFLAGEKLFTDFMDCGGEGPYIQIISKN
jgi:hypothetical protein